MDSRPRINGKALPTYVGKRVTLLGSITKIGESGKSVEVSTTDHMKINVSLPETFSSPENTVVEIHGQVNSKSTIAADSIIIFENEDIADFDPDEYNEFLTIRNFKLGQSEVLRDAFNMTA